MFLRFSQNSAYHSMNLSIHFFNDEDGRCFSIKKGFWSKILLTTIIYTFENPYRNSYRFEKSVPVRIIRTQISVPVPYQKNPYRLIRTTYRTKIIRTTLSVPRTVPTISVPHYPYHVPYRKNPYHFIRTTYRTKKIRTVQDPYHVPDRTITYRRYGQPCP